MPTQRPIQSCIWGEFAARASRWIRRPSSLTVPSLGVLMVLLTPSPRALAAGTGDSPSILGFSGQVEISRAGTARWDPAHTNQVLDPGDRVRTGERSRATLRFSAKTFIRMDERSLYRIPESGRRGLFQLLKGALYLFHRDGPGDFQVETPTGYAVVLGTEFVLRVDDNNVTRLDLIDGEVQFTNPLGQIQLTSGTAILVAPNQTPAPTTYLTGLQAVQWCLYYPGVLWPPDVGLKTGEEPALAASLEAYQAGDLPQALTLYPLGRTPASPSERVYLAGLLLASGQVPSAREQLAHLPPGVSVRRIGRALERIIAAVQRVQTDVTTLATLPPEAELAPMEPAPATEWLAFSYQEQAHARLPAALAAARRAVALAPDFAFAWERVAELEFSFGRIAAAQEALEKSLTLAPRNAQAHALRGFLLAARHRLTEAGSAFDHAIGLDSALGNAWLGRGLVRIRRGQRAEGREDLTVAAAVEPQRAVFRSYLGKTFADEGDKARAERELGLARQFDPGDPTAWLYSALIHEEQNRINEAIRDLEQSQALNDHRAIYRSRLLLDQDQSVRGANLARVLQDAGLSDVATREAARAVNADYANFSSHLFLANTYDGLRDPNQVDLRYETPWLSEYLVANLLAPVGAGTLSQAVSQQEYSRLFEQDRVGLVSSTEYLSHGDWTQGGAVYGVAGQTGFALDQFYRSRHGQRRNDDLEQWSFSLQLKQQLTPSDNVYFQAIRYEADGGDLLQYYDPAQANPDVRVRESQEPILLAGYHHEWAPGSHTLVLAGRLEDTLEVRNPTQSALLLERNSGVLSDVLPVYLEQDYRSQLEIYTAEAQQIWQRGVHTLVAGGRLQGGEFITRNTHGDGVAYLDTFHYPVPIPSSFFEPNQPVRVSADFQRASAYLYEYWQVLPAVQLIGGLTYDWLTMPVNHRYAPVQPGESSTDRLSPKAGLILTPHPSTTVRAGYSQSLGGVSIDQSFQLEPTQIAGFNQAWRSLIPDSVAGANSGARFETWGLALDEKLQTGSYLGVGIGLLRSKVGREIGVYDFDADTSSVAVPEATRERLKYQERSLTLAAHQLIGNEWAFGARYRVSASELDETFPEIPVEIPTPEVSGFRPRQHLEAVLHEVTLSAHYAHASGLFGLAEGVWLSQNNDGYEPGLPGDDFWQFNIFVGYRLPRRRAEVRVGMLNITDQDYRLNPLNLTTERVRERTLTASLRLNF